MPADAFDLDLAAQEFGRKVMVMRRRMGLTQEELAARSGVSRNQIQNLEHSRNNVRDPDTRLPGRGNPRLDTIFALALALEVEVSVLVDPRLPLPSHQDSSEPPTAR